MEDKILHKEVGYAMLGVAIAVRKSFGLGHKEKIYQRAFEEELISRKIPYKREFAIKIFSPTSKKFMGLYRPDFLVANKVIVELKALPFLTKVVWDQVYQYLRNSEFELAYVINFSPTTMTTKRIICTNDHKNKSV